MGANDTVKRLDKVLDPPVNKQSSLLLRCSLSLRMLHQQRNVLRARLALMTRRVKHRIFTVVRCRPTL